MCKPEAVTVLLGREAELEQPLSTSGCDADAGILHLDDEPSSGPAGVHAQRQLARSVGASFSAWRALLSRLPRIWMSL